MWASLALAGVLLAASPLAAAPPEVKGLLPAAVGRGETVSLTVEGTFAEWPVRVLVDGAGVTAEAEETKGRVRVQVAEDAPAGICLLRVADKQGLSAARPLIIDALPSLVEKEPNDEAKDAQLVERSSIVSGQLARNGDVDTYRVRLDAGQTLIASLAAHHVLRSPMDGVLQVATPAGFVLGQSDDERGLDPLLSYSASESGEFLVRVFAFPETPNSTIGFAGGADFRYCLTLTTGGLLDAALPMTATADQPSQLELLGWNLPEAARLLPLPAAAASQPAVGVWHADVSGSLVLPVRSMPSLAATGGTLAEPQEIPLPATVGGRLTAERSGHAFRFLAGKGQALRISADSFALGYPLDPKFVILDESGKQVAEADDTNRQRDASLVFRAPAEGPYRVLVGDLHGQHGQRFVYRLTLEPVEPDAALTVAQDAFSFAADQPLEIPVTIDRRDGFDSELEITAEGLPDGLSASVEKSAAKGDSAKQVKLKLTASGACEPARFRVVARVPGADWQREATLAGDPLQPLARPLWIMAR
ncbi:MAG: hypothetical protein J5I93_01530 [Pirellulaceae bacterium]|nr:hypothetical protein [Pirellulaceae bacterium]